MTRHKQLFHNNHNAYYRKINILRAPQRYILKRILQVQILFIIYGCNTYIINRIKHIPLTYSNMQSNILIKELVQLIH